MRARILVTLRADLESAKCQQTQTKPCNTYAHRRSSMQFSADYGAGSKCCREASDALSE